MDVRDAFFFMGLMLAGAGLWMISPPWALVAVGAILLLLSLARRFFQ